MRRVAIVLGLVVAGCRCGFALNPSLDISQYAHTAWTAQDGIFKGNIFSVAQTADGYLWLGTEFGLFRFDGVHSVLLQPPDGPDLPEKTIFRLLGARDGTLWIGTFQGLAAWSAGKLTRRPELEGQVVGSLMEDRDGTVWAGTWLGGPPPGRLCAIRNGAGRCYGEDGVFGSRVSSLYQDGAGNLWAGAASGIFRWKPGPPKRYAIPPVELTGLSEAGDGRLIGASYGAGLMQLVTDKVGSYPVRGAMNSNRQIRDRDVDANKLLRDRDGGLWIGTVERGLIHLHNGRTDVFRRSDGLSGDVILSLFEDREGNVWVSTTGGLDRFREFAVSTISAKEGLSSDAASAVLAATDGSIWIGAHDGLTLWNNGKTTIFHKASGLPGDFTHSLFQDNRGRIWVFTEDGPAYLRDGRFVSVNAAIGRETYCVTGDKAGDLWISQNEGLARLREGHFVQRIPWSDLGRDQQAKVVLADPAGGGMWLGFWRNGGVLYLKDGQLRESYATRDGLGAGHIADLRLDRDAALWAATEEGGLSRLKDGRIATLTIRNGLPCDTIHWSMEDDDRSLWLYTGCGLVRVRRTELDAWIADPKRTIGTTMWDASEGVKLRAGAASPYAPRIAKARDGRLWFLSGEGVQVVDPRRLAENKTPPPVRIEQVEANGKPYPLRRGMRLPANVRDLSIDFTALSLAAPEKVRFKYKLEGQDPDWKEVVNNRQAHYSNLKPHDYRFRVIACNNSGLWNETGDTLEFSVDPAFRETAWFYAVYGAAFLTFLWALYRLRVHQLAREFNARGEERTRIARELHDTLLQSFQGLMFSFQAARNLLPGRTDEAIHTLDDAIRHGDEAIAEGRNAIQGLRATPTVESDFGHLLASAGNELASASSSEGEPAKFRVAVEGVRQSLSPLLQDEIYRIACEILRNAFHHAKATRIEAEITYDGQFFRLRIRDDGKGIDRTVLEHGGGQGHWGLRGVGERAKSIGARLKLWSEPGAGTEAELTVPARIAYRTMDRSKRNAADS